MSVAVAKNVCHAVPGMEYVDLTRIKKLQNSPLRYLCAVHAVVEGECGVSVTHRGSVAGMMETLEL